MLKSIYAGTDLVNASESAKNIGVCFDNLIIMEKQITLICKSAFYHLHNIAKIRKFISFKDCETLIHAFVSTKLDYCNSLLSGLSQSQIQKLQYVQDYAARLLTGTRKYDSITPILKELHWLPVAERIHYKILLLTFKSLNNLAPFNLKELLTPYVPTRTLRSSNEGFLRVPRCNLRTYGDRAFSHIAPTLWNSLPEDMRTCKSLNTFKSQLKTFLFKRIFN